MSVETARAELAGAADDELTLALDHIYEPDGTPGIVPCYHFRHDGGGRPGRIRLRVGRDARMLRYGGQVGYDVDAGWRGRRLAGRSVRLLLPFARTHGLDPLWLTCDPRNAASRRTLEGIGARFVERLQGPDDDPDAGLRGRGKCRYRLDLPSAA